MHRPSDVEAILHRAAQIEAAAADPAATLTDADLVEAGQAAGLSEDAIRQAIAEQRMAPAGRAGDDEALRWTVTRRVTRLTDGQRAEMFSALRRADLYRSYTSFGQMETFGQAQQWTCDFGMFGPYGRLRVGPDASGEHDVWTVEHNARADVAGWRWLAPLTAGLIAAGVGILAVAKGGMPALIAVAVTLLAMLASLATVAPMRKAYLARKRRQFDALVNSLDRIAPAERADAPERAPLLTLDDETPASEPAQPVRLRART